MNLEVDMKAELRARTRKKIYQFFVPARINLIGEHLDYAGGKVVPAAIDLGISAFAAKSNNIEIKSLNINQEWKIDNDHFSPKTFNPQAQYFNFVYGVIEELRQYLGPKNGFKLILHSTIPFASGLSSSASFGVLIINIFCKLYQLNLSNIERAKIFQRVENNFIGLKSGLMDQFAILKGKQGYFIELNTQTLQYKYVKANQNDYKFLLISTNKTREVATSKYNQRVSELTQIAQILNLKITDLATLKDLSILESLPNLLLKKRLRHIITESQRVQKVVSSLQTMNGQELGAILNAAHESLDKDYHVSAPEANFIHQQLLKINDVFGSRIIGAGFGGCLIVLVAKNFKIQKLDFQKLYFTKFKLKMQIYECNISNGSREIDAKN